MSEYSTKRSRVDYPSKRTRVNNLIVSEETLNDYSPKTYNFMDMKPKIKKN